jgi:hypothetical protein
MLLSLLIANSLWLNARRDYRMFRIPGDEYISSCLFPLRSRYSIALKSFLLTDMFFRNSALLGS